VPELIGWETARSVGKKVAERQAPLSEYERRSLEADFEEMTLRAESLVAAETGLVSLAGPARARVTDRSQWIDVNVASFRRLLRPLASKLESRMNSNPRWSLRSAGLTRYTSGVELGVVLGWMSGRVLGQYDQLLIEDEDPDEQDIVYYVGSNVVQVERLREVQASIGLTRIDAPDRGDPEPRHRAPLATGRLGWVPAVERRGEGIFLELDEVRVTDWCHRVEEHPDIVAIRSAYARWRDNRDLDPDPTFPVARYLLIHTLSHLLLREVALECGYSSASIRERLYVGTPDQPTAGVLLSTAASDSEGTLGGLVALGEERFLGRLLDQAFEGAETCSSDPLCSERVPEPPSDQLHAAACHACLFASETSCEVGNRWLHRGVLVDLGNNLALGR